MNLRNLSVFETTATRLVKGYTLSVGARGASAVVGIYEGAEGLELDKNRSALCSNALAKLDLVFGSTITFDWPHITGCFEAEKLVFTSSKLLEPTNKP